MAISGKSILAAVVAAAAVLLAAGAGAQEVKHYRFAYDQPRNTGYSHRRRPLCRQAQGIEQGHHDRSTSIPARSSGRSRRCCSS